MALIKTNARGQSSNLGRRRLNPNGAMTVSQRATTKATLTNGYNCLDRVYTYGSHDGVVEESQSTDVPNSEFYNSLKHRVTTADTSIAVAQYHALSFRLEGNSVTQLGFGTSGAKKVTVSFWVKSSVAGAYGAALRNVGGNRFNQATMTINSADTWEKKSITYTGDTSGTWPKDNTEGLQFQLSQAMGTDYQGTSADTWVTSVDVSPANQVNWLATVGNTFYITGSGNNAIFNFPAPAGMRINSATVTCTPTTNGTSVTFTYHPQGNIIVYRASANGDNYLYSQDLSISAEL